MRVRWDASKGRPEPLDALDRIKLEESGEPLVDIRKAAPSVRLERQFVIPYLRKTVAEMLERAASVLPKGRYFGVTDAWRPIERQQRIYDTAIGWAREAFPDRGFASLRRTVNRYVHATNRKAPPGHTTGAAVDVQLLDEKGEVVDVWSPWNRFAASRTYTLGLEAESARNREILVGSMLGAGFSNCRDEYWHYSYGDAAWAVRTGGNRCIYGIAMLDPNLYHQLEEEHAEYMRTRENPFLAARSAARAQAGTWPSKKAGG